VVDNLTIIKRKKVFAGDGHHGGAWKVAYADFVTSMMAFFMLLWILNVTTESQKSGLADYFDPSIPVSANSSGGEDLLFGDGLSGDAHLASDGKTILQGPAISDADLARMLSTTLDRVAGEGAVTVTLSPEGVQIELLDTAEDPIFRLGEAGRTKRLETIIAAAAPVLRESGRRIKIAGHTDNVRFAGQAYTNWELSVDRANMARRLAVENGVPEGAFYEVAGYADKRPSVDDPSSAKNRRIAFQLLNPETLPLTAR
jgi:chemotaxis protein MotB